jgi:hypothetical protein
MPEMSLRYKTAAREKKEAELARKPGLVEYVGKLENAITENPTMAEAERYKLKDGRIIECYSKSIRAASYCEAMPFSKSEIIMKYVVFPNNLIVIVDVFFP